MLASSAGHTAYRIDQLAEFGWDLSWPDANRPTGIAGRVLRSTERLTVPWHATWAARTDIRAADAVLSMFESDGNGYAAWRALHLAGPPHVMIVCWLTEILRAANPGRLAVYRRLYAAVDQMVALSSNQVGELARLLDRDPATIHTVRFGTDLDGLGPAPESSQRTGAHAKVLAVGRDAGRDWSTLASAVRGRPFTVDVVTRTELVRHIDCPANMVVLPPVPLDRYLDMLREADVVVIPSLDRSYPTGQTVMLEAMALGKPCVVTATDAMSDYLRPGVDCLDVPVGDPGALGDAIEKLADSPDERTRLGAAAVKDRDRLGSRQMWKSVSQVLSDATGRIDAG